MPSKAATSHRPSPKAGGRRAPNEGKVGKEFWLDPQVLAEAQTFLGTATERETVEVVLDLVAFRKELAAGTHALRGMPLARVD